jgi:amidase
LLMASSILAHSERRWQQRYGHHSNHPEEDRMDDATFAPAHELARSVREGEISSRELLDHFVDRITRLNDTVNAVVTLDVERAQAAATRADEARARGDALGPLHGLPITMKDAIETEGIRSTGGATELTDHVPSTDAVAVQRAKAAGAIVFGKTNVPRWSGDLQTYNDIFGTTNNPWDVTRGPGGSSGGAATSVACGFTSFEIGTDIVAARPMPTSTCSAPSRAAPATSTSCSTCWVVR